MDFKEKISLAKTVDDITRLRQQISTSYSINRRTVEGRRLTEELLQLCTKRLGKMEKEGILPF